MNDQATNLRLLAAYQQPLRSEMGTPYQTIMVTGGKGGVGKSSLSLYLSYELARAGERVLLVDSNLQNPNLHILTNCDPAYPVCYWLKENAVFEESALISLGDNLDLIGNKAVDKNHQSYYQEDGLLYLELLQPLASRYDYVVLDTQTGLSRWNLTLLMNADLCLLVTVSDPTSIIDTYTVIKAALPHLNEPNFRLIVNQVIDTKVGSEAHMNLNAALNHFLNYEVELLSLIPFDLDLMKAAVEQKPLWQMVRNSRMLKQVRKVAETLQRMKPAHKVQEFSQYQEVTS
ncbi:MAG: hypothetical protein Kow0042_03360 [Calditrichia bacterium]